MPEDKRLRVSALRAAAEQAFRNEDFLTRMDVQAAALEREPAGDLQFVAWLHQELSDRARIIEADPASIISEEEYTQRRARIEEHIAMTIESFVAHPLSKDYFAKRMPRADRSEVASPSIQK